MNDRKKNIQNCMLVENPVIVGKYGIPYLHKESYIPSEIVSFSDIKTTKVKQAGVHFFIDDYRFERLWSHPYKYLSLLKQFSCIFAPDFSLYADMPPAMKIWNVYRNRLIGQWLQKMGVRVIPTIAWAEPASFEYCFDGVETGGTVAVSTVGSKRNSCTIDLWKRGMTALIRGIAPTTILIYGEPIDFNFGIINVRYFNNNILSHLHKLQSNDNS